MMQEFLNSGTTGISSDWKSNPKLYIPVHTNKYFPYYSLFNRAYLFTNSYKDLCYSRLPDAGGGRVYSSYRYLFNYLSSQISAKPFKFKYKGESCYVNALKGCLFDSSGKKILMCLAFSDSEAYIVSRGIYPLNWKKFGLKLFITNEFFTNPMYSTLFRKVSQLYITYFVEMGVPVEIVHYQQLEEDMFNPGITLPEDISSMGAFEHSMETTLNLFFNRGLEDDTREEYYIKAFVVDTQLNKINSELEDVILIDG